MKRRLLGVFVMLFVGISLLAIVPPAIAAAPGGIQGTATATTDKSQPCPNVVLTLDPTGKTVTANAQGVYNTGRTLTPGTYQLTGTCTVADGTTYPITGTALVAAGSTITLALTADTSANGSNPNATDPPESCNAGKGFTWLVCGAIRTMVGTVDWIRDSVIVPFLIEKPLDKNTDKDALVIYNVWSGFRNVASVFFILIFFIIIFGTAIGWDNYTVKKALPKLVMGAIFVPFSWYVCVLVIDISNILGQGLVALTSTVIPSANINFTSSISKLLLGGLLVGGAIAAAGALAVIGMGIVFSMLLAFLMVFLTLVLRKILITLLIVISPFAFVAWILPNTEKWFKEWWTNFFKLVMMYPIIMLLFEAGRLFAATAGATAGNALQNGVTPFFQLVGLTLPLFGVPMAFKWAGAALGAGNKAIGRATGAVDKRYGKDSSRAKERAHHRELNNANRALDFENNRIGGKKLGFDSKALGAVKRGITSKRSGQGGFFGNSKVPILKNNANQQQRMNAADAKFKSDEAGSHAIDKMRKNLPQTAETRLNNQTEAAFGKRKDERIQEELLAMKNKDGIALKDINRNTGDDASKARIAAARATGDKQKVIDELNASSGGIDHVEAMVQDEMRQPVPNEAKVAAALMALSKSQSGIDRAQEIAAGRVEDVYRETTDSAGNVTKKQVGYAGGGGYDAPIGTAAPQQALLGGDDEHNVGPQWMDAWTRSGMSAADSPDVSKSMKNAAKDLKSDEMAGYSPNAIRRLNAAYYRNQTGPLEKDFAAGREDYNAAAAEIIRTPNLRTKFLTNSKTAIAVASELDHPVIDPALGIKYRAAVTPAAAAPVVPSKVGQAVVAATGGSIVHASEIHRVITNEIETSTTTPKSSAIQTNIENHLLEHPTLKASDLPHVGAPVAGPAPTPGETALPPALEAHVVKLLDKNLDALAALERRFRTDADYRAKITQAYLHNAPIPPAIPPPS